jgi:hypothetical protein
MRQGAVRTLEQPVIVRVSYDLDATRAAGETIFSVRNADSIAVTLGTPKQVHAWLQRHGYAWCIASRGVWKKERPCSSS